MALLGNIPMNQSLDLSYLGMSRTQLNASFSTTNTALTNITQGGDSLNFAVLANEKFIFDCLLNVTSSSTSGTRVAMTFPAAGFLMGDMVSNVGSSIAFRHDTLSASGIEGATTLITFAGTPGLIRVSGSYINGANAGIVQMLIRSLSGAQTITVNKGSYISTIKF